MQHHDFTYRDYCARFGDPSGMLDALPWQISPSCANWREPVENVFDGDPRLASLLQSCVNRGRPFTARELVDTLYLSDEGVYTFQEVTTRDYADFIRRVSCLVFDY